MRLRGEQSKLVAEELLDLKRKRLARRKWRQGCLGRVPLKLQTALDFREPWEHVQQGSIRISLAAFFTDHGGFQDTTRSGFM